MFTFLPGFPWLLCGRSSENGSGKSKEPENNENDIEEWVVQGKTGESGTPIDEDMNGEIVRADMDRECQIQRTRTWILAIGFSMSVVGIWGDGA